MCIVTEFYLIAINACKDFTFHLNLHYDNNYILLYHVNFTNTSFIQVHSCISRIFYAAVLMAEAKQAKSVLYFYLLPL